MNPTEMSQNSDQLHASAEFMALVRTPAGKRLVTRDGNRFIRTDRYCDGFCNLRTGHICSAHALISNHGGCLTHAAYFPPEDDMRNEDELRDIQDTVNRYNDGIAASEAGRPMVLSARIDAFTQGNFDCRCDCAEPPLAFLEVPELLAEWYRGYRSALPLRDGQTEAARP
jgi:hypothetical protein